jgi:hypothetical protein
MLEVISLLFRQCRTSRLVLNLENTLPMIYRFPAYNRLGLKAIDMRRAQL